jgi:lysyl-tRNA synthetase class 2
LQIRAKLYALLRAFFAERAVLEVDPPILATTSVTDLHIDSIKAQMGDTPAYLQTSP